jgi:hypothetical protein
MIGELPKDLELELEVLGGKSLVQARDRFWLLGVSCLKQTFSSKKKKFQNFIFFYFRHLSHLAWWIHFLNFKLDFYGI